MRSTSRPLSQVASGVCHLGGYILGPGVETHLSETLRGGGLEPEDHRATLTLCWPPPQGDSSQRSHLADLAAGEFIQRVSDQVAGNLESVTSDNLLPTSPLLV